MVTLGEGVGGEIHWEIGIEMYEDITNKSLLCSTGNCTRYSLMGVLQLSHLLTDSKIQYKPAYLWNKNRLPDIEKRLVVAKGEGEGRGNKRECRISRGKLVYVEWINHKVLLYITALPLSYSWMKLKRKRKFLFTWSSNLTGCSVFYLATLRRKEGRKEEEGWEGTWYGSGYLRILPLELLFIWLQIYHKNICL